MYEFKLPDVGEGMHEAEIVNWLVKVGDNVKLDQPMLEIQTDKALVEIPAPTAGIVTEIRAKAGQIAHVGDIVVVIQSGNGQPTPTKITPVPVTAVAPPLVSSPGRRVLAAPAVRKLALEMGLDIAQVPPSSSGRILLSDLKQFAEQKTQTPPPLPAPVPPPLQVEPPPPEPPKITPPVAGVETTESEPLQGLRRRIAERMEIAWRVPHVTSFDEVEVSKLVALRHELKLLARQRDTRLTYLPFIIKAVTQALKEFPYFNASLDMANQQILKHRHYHIGIATAIPEGLLVPVIHHADRQSLLQLAQTISRLTYLAHERRLTLPDLSGGTFSITNFGSTGGQQGTPIINPPEVAILGIGRIEDKPMAVNGQVEIRPMLHLALSFDHRLVDGASAAHFLGRIKALLHEPNLLLLEM